MPRKFADSKCGEAKRYADTELELAKLHRFAALDAQAAAFDPKTATYDQEGLAEYVRLWRIGHGHALEARFHYA